MKTQTHVIAGNQNAQRHLLLRPTEAAETLAISIRSLDYLRANGQISPIKIGKSVRYPMDEIQRFVSARRQPQPHVGRPRNGADTQTEGVQP